ncbi:hypothetical protein ACF0H5_008964 [Mactra antiquata]
MANCTSEYQAAFKDRPWQARPQSLKPGLLTHSKDMNRAPMERKSTYGVDYMYPQPSKQLSPKKHKSEQQRPNVPFDDTTSYRKDYFPKKAVMSKPRSPNVENAKVIHPSSNQAFQGDTIYTASYPSYELAIMNECKQHPIKAKDNIDIPRSHEVQTTTAQDDFIFHQNVERPSPIVPIENTKRPTDPMERRTEYNDFFTSKTKDPHLCKNKAENARPGIQFDAISTAMADFTKPTGFERPKPCPPQESNHFIPAKFDATTTFNTAYKPWPVKKYELPIWAQKPKYKRPTGGMIVNSLYMHDFRNPQMIVPPTPINPEQNNKNTITNHDNGDSCFEKQTTYNKDYKMWTDVHPRESYRIIEVYKPPKEKMVCETNQRSHFTGFKAEKMKPFRPVSQHRNLNSGYSSKFATTYNESFTYNRPRSTPTSSQTQVAVKQRSNSAVPSSSKNPFRAIPEPELVLNPSNLLTEVLTSNEHSSSTTETNTQQNNVDILKVNPGCSTCDQPDDNCACPV